MIQGSAEWLEWRRKGLGGSDAAAVLGIDPWRTAGDVYRAKVEAADTAPNVAMIRGTKLEPLAREDYRVAEFRVVEPGCFVHPLLDWMRASVDGFDAEGAHGCEIKCPGEGQWHAMQEQGCPPYYYAQIQHCYAVTGAATWDLWVWDPGRGGYCIPVARDDAYIADLIEQEQRLWEQHVLARVPPPEPTFTDERTDDQWVTLATEYRRAEAAAAEWTARKDAAREALEAAAGLAQRVRGGGILLSRYTKRGYVDWSQVPELQGVDTDQYRRASTTAIRITVQG